MNDRLTIRQGDALSYPEFIQSKTQLGGHHGFKPIWLPDALFDFQSFLCDWAIRKGRGALFEGCGMGKTCQQLVWAENIVRRTNRHVLILTPIAVGHQTVREAQKFGIEAVQSRYGKLPVKATIVVTNYERLHYFSPNDFSGACCDESSILKNFNGAIRASITEFMRTLKYRLLCTATAAPNDHVELGTSSEALGELGFTDMVGRFFKKAEKTQSRKDEMRSGLYRFRGHAERDFWRWVCSWSRAVRAPSDIGFSDDLFRLPPLVVNQHIVRAQTPNPDFLFDLPACTLEEQRDERRRTLAERCEMAATLINATKKPALAWCHLCTEGDLLASLIPGATQISGDDSEDRKEEIFTAFENGQCRVIVTKPSIAAWGLNLQHCAHQTTFPSHSFEQWYQSIRRSWRFGQKNPVTIDVISSEGEARVLANLQRKGEQADKMFASIISLMGQEMHVAAPSHNTKPITIPSWLS